MIPIAVVPLFAAVALASSSSSLIPSGISSSCTSFLTSFNQDTGLANCTAPLINATAEFGASASSSASPSASSVESALATLCDSTSACTQATISSKLAAFYSACEDELTSSPNAAVLRQYDVLYSIVPLMGAMCSKDDSGQYCVMQISTASSNSSGTDDSTSSASGSFSSISQYLYSSEGSTAATGSDADSDSSAVGSISSAVSNVTGALRRRDTGAQNVISIVPNVTTFSENNILFLFLSPNLSATELCSSCTRNILTAYIDFESNVPYAPGIAASTLMSGQTALYMGVEDTCGASFLSGAAEAAGTLSGGLFHSGAPRTIGGGVAAASAVMGATILAVVSLL